MEAVSKKGIHIQASSCFSYTFKNIRNLPFGRRTRDPRIVQSFKVYVRLHKPWTLKPMFSYLHSSHIAILYTVECVIQEHVTCAFVNVADGEIYSNKRSKTYFFEHYYLLFNDNMTKCPIKYKVAICGRTNQ